MTFQRNPSRTNQSASTPARELVAALASAGVSHAFMVPGESFLPIIEALDEHPDIRLVSTRHEGGASFMASAYSRLTGRPALCLASRIPGASNLSIGLHTALTDGCPVIAVLGQVSTVNRYRGAFQEVDLVQFLMPVTKWVAEPTVGARLGELGFAAARRALAGRPGPTALIVAQDVLQGDSARTDYPPVKPAHPGVDESSLANVFEMLRGASAPVAWLGGGVVDADAADRALDLVELEEIPVVTAWRRPDAFPNSHRLYLGQSGLGAPLSVRKRLAAADVILAVGTQLSQLSTYQYDALRGQATILHVLNHVDGLGGPFSGAVGILSDPGSFLGALATRAREHRIDGAVAAVRRKRNDEARAEWLAGSTPSGIGHRPGYVDQGVLAHHLRSTVGPQSVVTNDAGSFSAWVTRYLTREQPRTYLAPTSGAMGYAIPAAIAAGLANPGDAPVAIVGDGGFMMTGSEIQTAVRERVPIKVIVVDNSQYGTIRLHQERVTRGAYPGSSLGSIDFAGYARSLGANGFTVSEDSQVALTLEKALGCPGPAVVHVVVDPTQLEIEDV